MKISLFFLLMLPVFALGQSYTQEIENFRLKQKESFLNNATGPLRKQNIDFLTFYNVDAKYKVEADIEILHGEPAFQMPTYDGTSNPYKRYALAHFNIEGKPYTLTLYQSITLFQNPKYNNYLFLPFLDQSNEKETYGGGRYLELDASDIQKGTLTIDFNKAYNPYCAYSSGYRCPQPPAENILPIAILAGEKKYIGPKNERPVNHANAKNFNETEKEIILSADTATKLHVYQVTDEKELAVLKQPSIDIKFDDPLLQTLANRMLLTVQDPDHPGVGIAAPQVGINKNIIWVQRVDKVDHPFELYINPKIIWRSKLWRQGLEGCLSIPDRKESIERSYAIRLQHVDARGTVIEENIEGFAAVIFQHEVDHLYGILYPDRKEEQEKKVLESLNEKIPFSIEKNYRY